MPLDPEAQRMVDQMLRARGFVETSNDAATDWAEMLESMRRDGVDISQPQPVSTQIVFPDLAATRRGGAELLVAGYPGIRAGGGASLYVLMQIVLTVDALGQIRANLESFAGSRNAYVADEAEGGEQVIGLYQWRGRLDHLVSLQMMAAADQSVLDGRFAWDVDPRSAATVTFGVGFADEATARRAGADLFVAGWPEIHIARGETFWTVEVVLSLVPLPEQLRKLREELNTFAAPRAGAVAGMFIESLAPKEVQEES